MQEFKKIAKKTSVVLVILLLVTEMMLRIIWGFGTPVLYVYSEAYEYIYAPNQEVERLGNTIITNRHSMRSKAINPNCKRRILGLGDSVINGGSLTSHENLATSILTDLLSKHYNEPVEILNAAAGSWGPDNAMAYVKEKGHFDASAILLVVSSHDLYDVMTHENIVGRLKSYPDKNPWLAIGEVIDRYLFKDNMSNANLIINKSNEVNTGFVDLIEYCRSNQIELVVYLHPELSELRKGEYSENGKDIVSLMDENGVHVIKGIDAEKENGYRDRVHLNDEGQKILAETLLPYLKEILN